MANEDRGEAAPRSICPLMFRAGTGAPTARRTTGDLLIIGMRERGGCAHGITPAICAVMEPLLHFRPGPCFLITRLYLYICH